MDRGSVALRRSVPGAVRMFRRYPFSHIRHPWT